MLPWLTAWARLVVDDATAADVAERAVVRAASGRKALAPLELRVAARAEAARLLAREVAAVPEAVAPDATAAESAVPDASRFPTSADVTAVFAPASADATAQGDPPDALDLLDDQRTDQRTDQPADPDPDPRQNTATGRLAIALEALAPYERLACVSYFVDGASTDAVAALLGVSRERAIGILDGAAPVLARAVGESDLPDFSVATEEVKVIAR